MTIAQLRSMTADASGQGFVLPMPAGSLEPSVPVHQAHLLGRILGIMDNETTCDITISDTTGSLTLSHSFSPDDADWAHTRAQLQYVLALCELHWLQRRQGCVHTHTRTHAFSRTFLPFPLRAGSTHMRSCL